MHAFEIAAALVVLAALCSFLNYRYLRLPSAIGLMAIALAGSLVLVVIGTAVPTFGAKVQEAVRSVDLNQAFLHGMLGFMLFAGSLHIDLRELARRKWTVGILASAGVIVSTIVVGGLTWGLLSALGLPARPLYCLLFGALISPTDPIAVLAILRQAQVPKQTEIKITGESLFNDGVGVVVFLGLLEATRSTTGLEIGRLAETFLWEAGGGTILGFAAGWIVYRMLRIVDNYQVEVLLSVALVAGGYALASRLHVSGPIAMVIAGLLIGNLGRAAAMSDTTAANLDIFWELVDEVLNAVLFVIIGLEVLVLTFTGTYLIAGFIAIPLVLAARFIAVALPITALGHRADYPPNTIRILTWGGLRGGISVALALSIPAEFDGLPIPEREVIIVLTYIVVVFSILVQGLTLGPLVRRWGAAGVAPD